MKLSCTFTTYLIKEVKEKNMSRYPAVFEKKYDFCFRNNWVPTITCYLNGSTI